MDKMPLIRMIADADDKVVDAIYTLLEERLKTENNTPETPAEADNRRTDADIIEVGTGIHELAVLYGVSDSTAWRYSTSDWFRPALLFKQGRIFRFDKHIAIEVAKGINKNKKND